MTSRPILCVVPHNYAVLAPKLEALVGPYFSRMVVGNDAASFAPERATTDELVLFVGGSGTHDVLKELCQWRTEAGERRVKWAHSYYTGLDAFNLPAIADVLEGVAVTNARAAFSQMLAEHVVLGCLYFNRQLPRLLRLRAAKEWDRYPSLEARGQTIGVLGYGDIGKACAKACVQGLGMKAIGWRTTDHPPDELGVPCVSGPEGMEHILRTCDFVVAVLPKLPHTTHILRREHFQMMRKDAVFLNVGRGATTVEADLAAAIRDGDIKGAVLDVFETEPLPASSPFWDIDDDRLLLSSHNADISSHSYADAAQQFVDLVEPYVTEGAIKGWRVDPSRGY